MATLCVIGAGPAGMMAAGTAARVMGTAGKVILAEKNARPGRKLAITGKGRCNVTHNADVDTLVANTPGNGKFLYPVYSRFSSRDLIDFFHAQGLPLKLERGGRYFPESDSARDVADCMIRYVQTAGVCVMTKAPVAEICRRDGGGFCLTMANGRDMPCDCVILCTGGISYPATGSTGDGYRMACALGHTLVTPQPALVPLLTAEKWVEALAGLTLKQVLLTFTNPDGRVCYREQGDMLFTHRGVSGPVVLSASRHMKTSGFQGKLGIDLKPALSREILDARLLRDIQAGPRKTCAGLLRGLLPASLVETVGRAAELPGDRPVSRLTREERARLVDTLKSLELSLIGPASMEEAIVTAGGIPVREIEPSTMASRIVPGLYFAGEIIDVDGYTGGFNLTAAFCTGYIAGRAAGEAVR